MDNLYFIISLMNSKKNKLQAEKIGRFICSFPKPALTLK